MCVPGTLYERGSLCVSSVHCSFSLWVAAGTGAWADKRVQEVGGAQADPGHRVP